MSPAVSWLMCQQTNYRSAAYDVAKNLELHHFIFDYNSKYNKIAYWYFESIKEILFWYASEDAQVEMSVEGFFLRI